MAKRRMFSLSVVDTDKFLEMPISSRLLYYELGMRADDDGFVDNWKKILLFTGLKEDDMKVLISKQFILPFESGVIVIRHWRMNNYLRNDRYVKTNYQNEYQKLKIDDNEIYQLDVKGIPVVYQMDTQDSIGKYSIGNKKEINKEKYGEFENVLLTNEEYHKLEESNLLPYIEKLSSYIASKGKKYKSHYATILNWSRKEHKEEIIPKWLDKEYVEETNEEAEEFERKIREYHKQQKKS